MRSKYDFSDMQPVAGKSEISEKIEKEQRERMNTRQSVLKRPDYKPRTQAEFEIARDANILDKGQQCEDDVGYALSYLPRDRFMVHRNVFIHGKNALGKDEDQEHDFIVVCNDAIFDIEAKSISGDLLTICPDGQWEVSKMRRAFAMPNPAAQVERHRQNITYRLQKRFDDMDIVEIVVTNNNRLLIQDKYGKLNFRVMKTDMLVSFIESYAKDCGKIGPATTLINDALLSGVRARKW